MPSRRVIVVDDGSRSSSSSSSNGDSRYGTQYYDDGRYNASQYSSSSYGQEPLRAYDPYERDRSRTHYYGSNSASDGAGSGQYAASNTRAQNPTYEVVRTPNPTGTRYSQSGGPPSNAFGYVRTVRRRADGSEVVTHNHGATYSDYTGGSRR